MSGSASASTQSPMPDTIIRLSFEFPRNLVRTNSDSRVVKPTIRQVEQAPRGARPPLKAPSDHDVPNKTRKTRPAPLDLQADDESPTSPLGRRLPEYAPLLSAASTSTTRKPLPPPSAPATAGHTSTPSFGSGRSVRPLPSVPPSATSLYAPELPITSPQTEERSFRPLPQLPSTPPALETDDLPPLDLATVLTTLLTPPPSSDSFPALPDIPPPSPISESPCRNDIPITQPSTLLKPTKPDLHLDVSPRTVRRMKGAAMTATPQECKMLAEMLRKSLAAAPELPTSFFCEAMLGRTNAVAADDQEEDYDSPVSSARMFASRRNTILSVTSDGVGYEVQLRMGDVDDEAAHEAEVVTWEWAVKDGVAAPSPTQVRPERLSRRWWRERNGVVVEEDYHNVVKILRSL